MNETFHQTEELSEGLHWPDALLHSAINAVVSGTGAIFGAGLLVAFGQNVPPNFFLVVPSALMLLTTARSLHNAKSQ